MTAEGPTGAPLRQQIAEAIRPVIDDETLLRTGRSLGDLASMHVALVAADAVVALLNLTEEQAVGYDFDEDGDFTMWGDGRPLDDAEVDAALATGWWDIRRVRRYVTPWLPTTPPDTSSSETT